MSLFGNERYKWRETYFVLFSADCRPSVAAVQKTLSALDSRYVLEGVRSVEQGDFESCTLFAPHDFSAMDITFIDGPEVLEQIAELMLTLTQIADTEEEKEKIASLANCDARLDIFHFEQMVIEADPQVDDENLDPGALLIVMDRLARLCEGVAVDPQSGSVL